MEPVQVVAAVIERDGKVLITRRRAGTHLAGLWEFPGGKPTAGEGPAEALRREIREELGALVSVGDLLETVEWEYPDTRVRLLFFRCELHGEARPLEGQEMAWVASADLPGYEFPPADATLVERLVQQGRRPGDRRSTRRRTSRMGPPIHQQITFLPTRDLAATGSFYERILGLALVLDQGTCRIYRVTAEAYVGFCESADAPERPGNAVTLTLVTPEVDQWYERLDGLGVAFEKTPQRNPRFAIYHCFLRDPNGYLIEIQRFEDPRWAAPGGGARRSASGGLLDSDRTPA